MRIRREKRTKGVATGEFELVPYFYTKGTAKTPSKPTATTEKLFSELEKAKTQPLWRVLVALSIRHVGPTGLPRPGHRLRHHGRHPAGRPRRNWRTSTASARSSPRR